MLHKVIFFLNTKQRYSKNFPSSLPANSICQNVLPQLKSALYTSAPFLCSLDFLRKIRTA